MEPDRLLAPKWLHKKKKKVYAHLHQTIAEELQNLQTSREMSWNVLTSALHLSSYPIQDLFHWIWEVLRSANCYPNQASISPGFRLVMAGWGLGTCCCSEICRHRI